MEGDKDAHPCSMQAKNYHNSGRNYETTSHTSPGQLCLNNISGSRHPMTQGWSVLGRLRAAGEGL